ncbi:MAG: hypothetical protein WBM62_13145, partial [Crocosphaera sp.]
MLILLGIINILGTSHIKSDVPDKVFTEWDVVLSWNRWAISWSQNQFPELTWEYPQLLPTNWAISYVLLGTDEIEFVAKSLMNVFPIVGVFSFVGLALNFSSLELLFGAAFSSYLLLYYSWWIGSGLADFPVTFFSAILFSYYYGCCWLNKQYQPTFTQLLILGIIAGGAGATKQTGVFLALVFFIILFINTHQRNKQFLLSHLSFIIPLMSIIGSWYVLKYILVNDTSSNVVMLMSSKNLHPDSFLPTRMMLAFKEYWSSPLLISSTIFALIIQPKPLKFLSQIIYIYVIPWTLIWSAFFSYDPRNSLPVYATLGLVAGCNIIFVIKLIITTFIQLTKKSILLSNIQVNNIDTWIGNYRNNHQINPRRSIQLFQNKKSLISYIKVILISLFVITIMSFYLIHFYYPNSLYFQRQTEAKLHRGSYELNQKLLNYFRENNDSEQSSKLIATQHQILKYVPGLSHRVVKYLISYNQINNAVKKDWKNNQKQKESSWFFELLGKLIKRLDFQRNERALRKQRLSEEAAFDNPEVGYLLYMY